MKNRLLVAAALVCFSTMANAASNRIEWDGDEDPGTIVISTSERKLSLVQEGGTAVQYSIAVGREGMQWKGKTRITHMRWRPEWRPTPRMRRENPKLPEVVKPGPRNPMGVAALYLAQDLLRIHGTNEPKSIGKAASSGCFRMLNEDISELYDLVEPDSAVIVRD